MGPPKIGHTLLEGCLSGSCVPSLLMMCISAIRYVSLVPPAGVGLAFYLALNGVGGGTFLVDIFPAFALSREVSTLPGVSRPASLEAHRYDGRKQSRETA